MNKTPQEQIKFIVENTDGLCWHEVEEFAGETMGHYYHQCIKCGIHNRRGNKYPNNLSPHSLDDLFRLAAKNDKVLSALVHMDKKISGRIVYKAATYANSHGEEFTTPADALRSALVQAIEGRG